MAELTNLEEKLAEVTGLAMAAEAAGGRVTKLTEEQDPGLVSTLQKMAKEAAETAQRCEQSPARSRVRRRRFSRKRARSRKRRPT